MYREAPPSDGEMLLEGWRGWQEKRKKEELEKNAEGKSEDEKARRNGNSSPRPSCRPGSGRAGTSLYGYSKHTAYEQGNTKPDELDLLVSKVTDKLSHWGKGISEKKMEERQRKEREALKKSISSPRPASSSTDNSGRPSLEPPSCRPSFGSGGSVRTGGSMAERMAKRGSFEIPFWPKGKGSAQHDERCIQVGGDSVDPELASAPWNQHVTKSSPFSSPASSRSSTDKERSDSPSNKFFGRFVPSPTSLFGSSHAAGTRRRASDGSDDSFFGCQGISVEEEHTAQHLVHQDRCEGHIESLDFRVPPTPPDGARELFGHGDDDDDRICYSRVSPQRPIVSDHGVDRRSAAAELVGQRQRRKGDDHEPDGDDNRVSWWDPPAEGADERTKHWRDYRRNLRGTTFSGREEGKPF
ncbi:hypothetical protein DIS24_g4014 [Lasiodiplodia hormozganensis]|uniref:Uncharacterized protein n=1 Tax=Lasiodiplodia hormozganensis TaxID=869390 RepID=A0AA39YWV4_9PEZI|nr:hypothetical protein DIS24_g4014 [Lasiodiplodia hormozganensis]